MRHPLHMHDYECNVDFRQVRLGVGRRGSGDMTMVEGSGVRCARTRWIWGRSCAAALMLLMLMGLWLPLMATPAAAGAAAEHQPAAAGIALVMVEAPGCNYCRQWLSEIGPEYSRTREGRFAPLARVMIGHVKSQYPHIAPVMFTPTFVITAEGREVARIEGYISEECFWPMLAAELAKLGFRSGQSATR